VAQTPDCDLIAFGIEAPSQFNRLSLSAADHERVEEKENPDWACAFSGLHFALRTQSNGLQESSMLPTTAAMRITGVIFSSKRFIV